MVALRSARSRDEIRAEMDEFSEDDRKVSDETDCFSCLYLELCHVEAVVSFVFSI